MAEATEQTHRRRLRRRPPTPVEASQPSRDSGSSLPPDVLLQTCRRVFAVSLVFSALWSFALLANGIVAPLLGQMGIIDGLWPYPGLPISITGLVLSLTLAVLARRLRHRPELLLDLSAGFMLIICFMVAIVSQWVPPPLAPRVSWLCLIIVAYPAIVPAGPERTLALSLIAATMDPLALFITHLRGVAFDHSAFYYIFDFVPTYIAAFVAVVPAKIIRALSHQVRRARELGSYRLEEVLGKGGMGEVYRGTHQMLARPAAVKVIRAEVLGNSSTDGARVIVERFRREAEAAASLRSPHTIGLYDFGVADDGTFFLVMELLDGLDLQSLVERFGPLPPERVVYLLRQVCHSLEEAHQRGLIHRDIKPSNIFTCRLGLQTDFVKVLDFGLVKGRGELERRDFTLTAPDATAGTPAYIAPEMVRGDGPIDHRVDIYALGCVAYWLLTGQLVFEAPNAIQLMIAHSQTPPVPPSQRIELEIPPALDALVLACLAKRADERPPTAAELGHRLSTVLSGEPWNEEKAQRWWHRHHPESARGAPTRCDLLLSRTMEEGWTPEPESADSELAANT